MKTTTTALLSLALISSISSLYSMNNEDQEKVKKLNKKITAMILARHTRPHYYGNYSLERLRKCTSGDLSACKELKKFANAHYTDTSSLDGAINRVNNANGDIDTMGAQRIDENIRSYSSLILHKKDFLPCAKWIGSDDFYYVDSQEVPQCVDAIRNKLLLTAQEIKNKELRAISKLTKIIEKNYPDKK